MWCMRPACNRLGEVWLPLRSLLSLNISADKSKIGPNRFYQPPSPTQGLGIKGIVVRQGCGRGVNSHGGRSAHTEPQPERDWAHLPSFFCLGRRENVK